MSLDSLPDEVLEKILCGPLVKDDPISTSIEAHDIYHAHIDCLEHSNNQVGVYFRNEPTQGVTLRRPAISALLLGVCKRWYRLGCPLFYQYNTFIVMYGDVAKFATQIGVHNSTFLRVVDLTVRHQDFNPGEIRSLLPKLYFEHVETFNIILAKRQSRVSVGHAGQGFNQDLALWMKMRDKAFYLRCAVYAYADNSGGKWTVVEPERCLPLACMSQRFLVTSAFWTLKRISTPRKDDVLGDANTLEGRLKGISISPAKEIR